MIRCSGKPGTDHGFQGRNPKVNGSGNGSDDSRIRKSWSVPGFPLIRGCPPPCNMTLLHGPRSPQLRLARPDEGFRRAETAQRMACARDARPLSVGIPRPRGDRARVPDHRQDRQRRRAAGAQGSGRFAGRADRRAGAAARSARRLRHPALLDHAVRGASRRRIRARDAARDPPRRSHRVPPHAQPVPALSSGATDGRRVARHRARHARHLDAAELHAVLHRPGGPGVHPGGGHPPHQVRLALRGGHLCRGSPLHRLQRRHHRVAHGNSPPGERAGLEGQHARDRQPAQLRDGEILQQRGIRGAPVRREPAEIRVGGGEERSLAGPAQHRAELHHRRRGDAADDPRCRRRGGEDPDAR